MNKKNKNTISRTSAALLSFFFGVLGMHRLAMGYKNWWLMPLTLGGFWLWNLYDLIRILSGKMKMANGEDLL